MQLMSIGVAAGYHDSAELFIQDARSCDFDIRSKVPFGQLAGMGLEKLASWIGKHGSF